MKSSTHLLCRAMTFCALAGAVASSSFAGTISYSYDQLGRLSQVSYPSGAILRYNYDPNGNRTSYVVTGSSNPVPTGTTPVGQAQVVTSTAPANATSSSSAN